MAMWNWLGRVKKEMNDTKSYKKALSIIVICTLLISHYSNGQQRPQFTQYISNELVINPAYAGAEGSLSVSFLHRNQWAGIEGAPTTQSFTAHSLINNNNVGLGLVVLNDQIGIHSIITASSSFAYRLQLKKETYLSFGLQLGANQQKSDFNSLASQVQTANDPTLNASDISKTTVEVGSGIYLSNSKLSLGISMPNMLNTTSEFDSIPYSVLNNDLFLLTRYRLAINSNITLQPGLLMKYNRSIPVSIDFNLAGEINKVLLLGISYRIQESLNYMVQAKLTPQFKLGYALDAPLKGEDSFGVNSHEFMISYMFHFANSKISQPR